MIKIELSLYGLMRVLIVVVVLAGLIIMRDIVFLLFVAYIMMLALFPLVSWVSRKGVSRIVSVLTVVIFLIILSVALLTLVLGSLVGQVDAFANALPSVLREVFNLLGIDRYLDVAGLLQSLQNLIAQSWIDSLTTSVQVVRVSTRLLANMVWVLVFTVYLIMEREKVQGFIVQLIPVADKDELKITINEVDKKLGNWLRSQMLLVFLIGSLTFVWLTILGVPYAGALATIAGVLEILPILGPTIATFIMAAVGLTLSPIIAITIIVISFVQQQIENDWLVPRLMKETVGLDPLITIIAILAGSRVEGMVGTILAVPTVVIFVIIYQRYISVSRENIKT